MYLVNGNKKFGTLEFFQIMTIKMDIDTGENPPVCQRSYTLPLKHAEWVKKELNILEAAGITVRSVSPWASPIVVVPKRSAPGEPPKRHMCRLLSVK